MCRYSGQRNEASLGLYDYGARMYHPQLGRFVSADSVVANANPLNHTDPSGHVGTPEMLLDVAFISYDWDQIQKEGWTPVNTVALIADVVGAIVPIATGAGLGVRALHYGLYGTSTTAKIASKADDVWKAAKPGIESGMATWGGKAARTARMSAAEIRAANKVYEVTPQQLIEEGMEYLYRGVTEYEYKELLDPKGGGLFARDYTNPTLASSHVNGQYKSEWISLSKDIEIARSQSNHIVRVKVSMLDTQILDVSNGIFGVGPKISNWAKASKEVLVQNNIDRTAIEIIK